MANRHRGEVTLQLDRTRTLRYNWNAIAEWEDQTKLNWIEYWQKFGEERFERDQAGQFILDKEENPIPKDGGKVSPPGFSELRCLLWAGLIHEDPDLTIRKVGDLFEWVDGDTYSEKYQAVLPSLVEAIKVNLADDTKKKIEPVQDEGRAGPSSSGSLSVVSDSPPANSGV